MLLKLKDEDVTEVDNKGSLLSLTVVVLDAEKRLEHEPG